MALMSFMAASSLLRVASARSFSTVGASTLCRGVGNVRVLAGNSRSRRWLTTASATETAQPGDKVQVHYTGTLDNGDVFDSSRGREPLSFTIGAGQVIKGFDTAVTGLGIGETRKQRIEPQDAYGEKTDKLTARLPKERCPPGLEVGDMVELPNGMPALITDVTEEEVEIDANHRLAGKALTFDVELVGLTKP